MPIVKIQKKITCFYCGDSQATLFNLNKKVKGTAPKYICVRCKHRGVPLDK